MKSQTSSALRVKTVQVGKVLEWPLARLRPEDTCGSFTFQTPSRIVYL
jgi:hypothetical protein